MLVANVMLGRGAGGIEQSFLDYDEMLRLENIEVLNITSNAAKVNYQLKNYHSLLNLGPWDIYSVRQLKKYFLKFRPDIIICHANRAIKFTINANKDIGIPVVGVAHKYSTKWIKHCRYIVTPTSLLKNFFVSKNYKNQIAMIPNTVCTKSFKPNFKHEEICNVIGTMGRFVKDKGFDIFLEALQILKNNGYKFKAVIGGEGKEEAALHKLCLKLGLNDIVTFIGWVNNKDDFFNNIGIFCLPSIHEPFGIILLEAMQFSKPIVSAMSEGPSEIIQDSYNGLLCPPLSPHGLAKSISTLLDNPQLAQKLSNHASVSAQKYDRAVVAKKLKFFLDSIIKI